MSTRRATISITLFALLLLAGCSGKEKPAPATSIAPPPANGDAPAATTSGAATDTASPASGDSGAAEAAIGSPTATVVAEGALAPYAAALAIVQPDHFAVIKLDLAALRNSAFVKSLPIDPQQMAKSLPVPGGEVSEFAEKLTQVESIWVSLGPPRGSEGMPVSLAIFAHCTSPQAVQEALSALEANAADADRLELQGIAYYKAKRPGGPIWAVRDADIYISSDENVVRNAIAAGGKLTAAPLLEKLQSANLDAPLFIAGSFGPVKDMVSAMAADGLATTPLSPELGKLPAQIDWAVIAIDPDAEAIIDIDVDLDVEQSAENLKTSLDGIVSLAKISINQELAGGNDDPQARLVSDVVIGALDAVSVSREGQHVDASFNRFPGLAKLPELIAAQVERARAMQYMNNARQLGLAALNHREVTRSFPKNVASAQGEALLSWRYEVLPYLEEIILQQQIKRDEAWNGATNQAFADKMPKVFASESSAKPNRTTWKLMPEGHPSDILILDTGKGTEVPWLQPDEFVVDAANPEALLGEEPAGGYVVVNTDGSVNHFNRAELVAVLSGKPLPTNPLTDEPAVEPPAAGGVADQPPRTWQDATGKFKIEAILVEVGGGSVTLLRTDTGKSITIPLSKLSQADQVYVQSLGLGGM